MPSRLRHSQTLCAPSRNPQYAAAADSRGIWAAAEAIAGGPMVGALAQPLARSGLAMCDIASAAAGGCCGVGRIAGALTGASGTCRRRAGALRSTGGGRRTMTTAGRSWSTSWPARLASWPIRAYRLLFSPWVGASCRFYPTCSMYALQALDRHGLLRGGALSLWRLLRCHPWCNGGLDPVPDELRSWRAAWSCRCSDPAGHESANNKLEIR